MSKEIPPDPGAPEESHEKESYIELRIAAPSQEELWAEIAAEREKAVTTILQEKPETLPGKPEDWYRALRAERRVEVTSRNLRQIADEHAMSVDELLALIKDKTVLNIGAGASTLAAEVAERQVPTNLISLDVSAEALAAQPGRKILASADSIPLDDGSVDVVLGTNAVPLWAGSGPEVWKCLHEAARVVAAGGVIKLTPIGRARTRNPVDSVSGHMSTGGERDRRFMVVLAGIDVATYDWLKMMAADPDFTVTLESSVDSSWWQGGLTSATIVKRK